MKSDQLKTKLIIEKAWKRDQIKRPMNTSDTCYIHNAIEPSIGWASFVVTQYNDLRFPRCLDMHIYLELIKTIDDFIGVGV